MRHFILSSARLCVLGLPLVVVTLACSSCAWMYLYDAKQEQATAAAKDSFVKLKFDEFQDHRAYLITLATTETTAVKTFMLADRDRRLATLIKPIEPIQSRESLVKDIDDRFQIILGFDPEKISDQQLREFSTLTKGISINEVSAAGAKKAFEGARDLYIKSRQDKVSQNDLACPDILARPHPTTGNLQAYETMADSCETLSLATTRFNLGAVEKELGVTSNSDFAKTVRALKDIRERRDKSAADEKRVVAQINDVLKNQAEAPASEAFKTAVTNLGMLLGNVSEAAQLLGAKILSEQLQQILTARLASDAGTSSSGSQSTDQKQVSATGRRAQAVLDLASAFAGAVDATSGKGQAVETEAMLIAIAALRQRADVARLEKDRDQAQEVVRQTQVTALIQEVALLARARLFASGVKAARTPVAGGLIDDWKNDGRYAAAALANYSQSWSEGRIPYYLGEFKLIQVDRSYGVEVAAKTAANWKTLLAPAIDQLAIDGKGGIKPETIAQLLGHLGIISAIAAK